MKKTLLAVIIAATALVPPAALAQDRGRWGGRDRGGNNGGQASEVRQNRGEWRQQQSQQTPQAQPQRQWNGGGERQRGERSGGWNRPQQTPQAVPQATPQQSVQQQRWGGNRGDRSQWNNSGDRSRWTGNRSQWNGGDRRPDAGQQQQQLDQQRQQQYRNSDRNRWNDGNRDRSQYNRGNRDWNDGNRNRDWNDRNRSNGWNDNRNRSWNNDRSRGSWNNNWRNDRRYDWRGYRSSNRNIYRLPRYYAPSGWGYGYRRFGIGFTLNSILFSSNYWINDPYYYRLPEVDGPYRWVRYYNDALLVDIYSGEVIDVIHDMFW